MRTTVTLDSAKLDRLVREGRFKSKAKAVEQAVEDALRLRLVRTLSACRGKATFDRRVLKWRHLAR